MRRFLAWAAGAAGGLAAYRAVARRRPAVVSPPPQPAVDPRAEELRARLDATRTAEPEPAPAPPVAETPDERRARVHEQGRAAVDEMRQGE